VGEFLTLPTLPPDLTIWVKEPDVKKITEMRPLIEINQQAIHLLYKELGVTDAVRFLKQFTQGYGNYTQERESLFDKKSLDEIVGEIEKRRKPGRQKRSAGLKSLARAFLIANGLIVNKIFPTFLTQTPTSSPLTTPTCPAQCTRHYVTR